MNPQLTYDVIRKYLYHIQAASKTYLIDIGTGFDANYGMNLRGTRHQQAKYVQKDQ